MRNYSVHHNGNAQASLPERPQSLEVSQFLISVFPKISADVLSLQNLLTQRGEMTTEELVLELTPVVDHLSHLKNELLGRSRGIMPPRLPEFLDEYLVRGKEVSKQLSEGNESDLMGEGLSHYLSDLSHALHSEFRRTLQERGMHLSEKLELLEFSSEFSGVPDFLFPNLIKLQKRLLIDPEIKAPQNGFGGIEEHNALISSLRLRQSLLYIMRQEGTVEGFCLAELNDISVRRDYSEIVSRLHEARYIHGHERLGYVRSLGIGYGARREGVRCRTDLYGEFALLITSAIVSQGVTRYFALVREGVQANTAIIDHTRIGIERTPIVVHYAGTPYRVLIGTPPDPQSGTLRPPLGLGSRFELWQNHPALSCEALEDAQSLYISEAHSICKEFANRTHPDLVVRVQSGAYAHSISFHLAPRICSLIQLRPRTDLWGFYGSTAQAYSLDKALPMVAKLLLYGEAD